MLISFTAVLEYLAFCISLLIQSVFAQSRTIILFCIWLAALLMFLFWIVCLALFYGLCLALVLLLETWYLGFFLLFECDEGAKGVST